MSLLQQAADKMTQRGHSSGIIRSVSGMRRGRQSELPSDQAGIS